MPKKSRNKSIREVKKQNPKDKIGTKKRKRKEPKRKKDIVGTIGKVYKCSSGIRITKKEGIGELIPDHYVNEITERLSLYRELDLINSEKNLLDFACMGSALYKSLFAQSQPRIALLNVGLEEHKGNDILKKTYLMLKNIKIKNFKFCGYIEGNHIMDGNVDVIVTDGFTGNIALKTAEGTANFITKNLKKSLNKLSMLLSYKSLKEFKNKLDPRKYNGAIFLGLESAVVKSHGATDSIGFAHSINVCNKMVKADLIEKIKSNLITVDA